MRIQPEKKNCKPDFWGSAGLIGRPPMTLAGHGWSIFESEKSKSGRLGGPLV